MTDRLPSHYSRVFRVARPFKFWEITDNTWEMMQDRETFTIEDKKMYVAYRMAPIPMTFSDSHTSTHKWESACGLLFQLSYPN